MTKKKATMKPTPRATAPKTTFREGSKKAQAFATFKAERTKYEALERGGKKEWQQALAKKLKLSPATVSSWCGGQFRKALQGGAK